MADGGTPSHVVIGVGKEGTVGALGQTTRVVRTRHYGTNTNGVIRVVCQWSGGTSVVSSGLSASTQYSSKTFRTHFRCAPAVWTTPFPAGLCACRMGLPASWRFTSACYPPTPSPVAPGMAISRLHAADVIPSAISMPVGRRRWRASLGAS